MVIFKPLFLTPRPKLYKKYPSNHSTLNPAGGVGGVVSEPEPIIIG